jgi:hypothetical protein
VAAPSDEFTEGQRLFLAMEFYDDRRAHAGSMTLLDLLKDGHLRHVVVRDHEVMARGPHNLTVDVASSAAST